MPQPALQPENVSPVPDQATDPLLYRVLVFGLVVCVAAAIAGIFTLALIGRQIPDGLVALGASCVGGLVGLLVPSPPRP